MRPIEDIIIQVAKEHEKEFKGLLEQINWIRQEIALMEKRKEELADKIEKRVDEIVEQEGGVA